MAFFSDLQTARDAVRAVCGEDAEALDIPSIVHTLPNEAVLALIGHANTLVRAADSVRIAAAGVVATRSIRESGHDGLAQSRGHRSPVALIQELTGSTRRDAATQVRLGTALTERCALTAPDTDDGETDSSALRDVPAAMRPWHSPLGDALLRGLISSAQHDAISRGLGDPPASRDGVMPTGGANDADDDADNAHVRDAWALAAEQLIDESTRRTVEELASAARTIRDLLDPAGAERRFAERFDGRSFRLWSDRDGVRRGAFAFDDEGGAWIESIIATALRPRRGGPRFVDSQEIDEARSLADDPRTNDQLAYDLLIDVLRCGALADAKNVFGTRQPGVRIVVTRASHDAASTGVPAVAVLEDSDATLPGWVVAQQTCNAGTVTLVRDAHGNPLDLGRDVRLYSSKQRVALAIRDGGCRINGCDRPASYCEAHHIDPFAEGGRTDIDRGILLCRFHHMNLHHNGWRIVRDGVADFVLLRPGAPPETLVPRLARRYAFGDLDPPPPRFRSAA